MRIRSEKGSVTVYVLVAMFFLLTVIAGRYVLANRNLKTQYDAIAKIKNIYSRPKEYGRNYKRTDLINTTGNIIIKFGDYKANVLEGTEVSINFTAQDSSERDLILRDPIDTTTYYVQLERVNTVIQGAGKAKIDVESDLLYTMEGSTERVCSLVQIDNKDYLLVKISTGTTGTIKRKMSEPISIFNHNGFKFFAKQNNGEVFYTYQVDIYYTYDPSKVSATQDKDRTVLIDKVKDTYILKSDIYIRLKDYGITSKENFVNTYSSFLEKLNFNNHVIFIVPDSKYYFGESTNNLYRSTDITDYIYYDTVERKAKLGRLT